MDERSFVALLRRQWLVVVVYGLAGTALALVYLLLAPQTYTARTELFVAAVGASSSSELAQGSDYSEQQARNYAVVATRQAVLDPVIADLRLDTSSAELSERVQATVPLNTSLISITVEDTTPERAAATADSVASSLTDAVGTLVPRRSDGTLPIRLRTVQEATVPESASAPDRRLALAAGLLGGLVLGTAFVAVRELAGGKVRSAEQVAQVTGLPVLGTITTDRTAPAQPVATGALTRSRRAEEFRRLRTNLQFMHAGEESKFFVITSSIPGEGKSSVAVNVAVAMAATGTRVCLVEADLRRPRLGQALDLEGSVGLTTVLAQQAELEDALQPWGPDELQVLLSGQIPPNPSELLGSPAAEQLFAELGRDFDAVVVDCPPLEPVTDAAVIAGQVGGAILVVGCEKVETREVRASLASLEASGSTVLGTIANFNPDTGRSRYTGTYLSDGVPLSDQETEGVS